MSCISDVSVLIFSRPGELTHIHTCMLAQKHTHTYMLLVHMRTVVGSDSC